MMNTTNSEEKNTQQGEKPLEAISDPALELKQTLQRVQADFENYQKRTAGEMKKYYLHGQATAWKEMLSFADTLESAVEKEKEPIREKIVQLQRHLLEILEKNGVRRIETIGKPFDPFSSECLLQGNDPTRPEDSVLEEIQKGYYFHEDVLRAAKIRINKKIIQPLGGASNE